MKRNLSGILIFMAFSTVLHAQFNSIEYADINVPNLSIVQIDNHEFSTIVHMQLENAINNDFRCVKEDLYIIDPVSKRRYLLLNSINFPICDKLHYFDQIGQFHYFSLEFEKLPDDIGVFDLSDNDHSGLNITGIRINRDTLSDGPLDINYFIRQTPVKEHGYYYKDGQPVYYYKHKGVLIAAILNQDNNYGKYYQVSFLIQNFTGREFNIYPDKIQAYFHFNQKSGRSRSKNMEDDIYYMPPVKKLGDKEESALGASYISYPAPILTYEEYMKKVKNQQAWATFAVALSQSLAASRAGYSSVSHSGYVHGYINAQNSISGNIGNVWGSIYSNSNISVSAYGNSTTTTYSGAAAYAAQQNAMNNTASFQNQQFEVRQKLSEGYLRLNTIMNQTEYAGYINIPFREVDAIQLIVPINGTEYMFVW